MQNIKPIKIINSEICNQRLIEQALLVFFIDNCDYKYKIDMMNEMLFDIFDQQKSIVKVKTASTIKNFVLSLQITFIFLICIN